MYNNIWWFKTYEQKSITGKSREAGLVNIFYKPRIRRKRAERLNQMGGSANTSRTESQIIRRELSAQQSEGVHVAGSLIETY